MAIYHRIVVWGWDVAAPGWQMLQATTRSSDDGYNEQGMGWEFDALVQQSANGAARAGGGIAWPGPPYSQRRDFYLVGLLHWQPGMPAWDWQRKSNVIASKNVW